MDDPSEVTCSICLAVPREPTSTPGGQVFCRECIVLWLNRKQTCPNTNQPLKLEDLKPPVTRPATRGEALAAEPGAPPPAESLWIDVPLHDPEETASLEDSIATRLIGTFRKQFTLLTVVAAASFKGFA